MQQGGECYRKRASSGWERDCEYLTHNTIGSKAWDPLVITFCGDLFSFTGATLNVMTILEAGYKDPETGRSRDDAFLDSFISLKPGASLQRLVRLEVSSLPIPNPRRPLVSWSMQSCILELKVRIRSHRSKTLSDTLHCRLESCQGARSDLSIPSRTLIN